MKAFPNLLKRMGMAALVFAGAYAVAMIVLKVVAIAAGFEKELDFAQMSDYTAKIYMLVIGIVCPLVYFNLYVAAGVTRRQFTAGMLAVAAVMSACFAILRMPLLMAHGELTAMSVTASALYGMLAFLVGWTAVIGFQFMRAIPIFLSSISPVFFVLGFLAVEKLSTAVRLPIFAIAIAALGAGLLWAASRIPVKI
jgi:hypothetical protein